MSEFGHKLSFNAENIAVCEESKQEYLLENNVVKRIK
jgi:UDP-2-acetamido-3-amino-2,3-dideoxy-glucuronate N-acetyltransferase